MFFGLYTSFNLNWNEVFASCQLITLALALSYSKNLFSLGVNWENWEKLICLFAANHADSKFISVKTALFASFFFFLLFFAKLASFWLFVNRETFFGFAANLANYSCILLKTTFLLSSCFLSVFSFITPQTCLCLFSF